MYILLHGTAVVGHPQEAQPPDPCEQLCEFRVAGDTPHVKPLIEVHPHAQADDLFDLREAPCGGQHVVVEQHGPFASCKELFDVGMGPDSALFARHHAPRTSVRASAREKAVGFAHAVERVIRTCMFDRLRQRRRIIAVARSAAYHLAAVFIPAIGRMGKDLRQIHFVVTPRHGIGKFHRIAPELMPRRKFHQHEVREVAPVHIHQSDSHGLLTVLRFRVPVPAENGLWRRIPDSARCRCSGVPACGRRGPSFRFPETDRGLRRPADTPPR